MDIVKNFNEIIVYSAIEIINSQIEVALLELRTYILKIEKIPKILRKSKKYETFSFIILANPEEEIINQNCDNPILNHSVPKKPKNDDNKVYLLVNEKILDDKSKNYKVVNLKFTLNAKFFTHSELFQKLISKNYRFSAYEVIGDIIHLNMTEEQSQYKQIVANILNFKTGKTIINKIGKIEDVFRFYKNEILAGDHSLITTHVENGVKFKMDLNEVYWCSRLQTERARILSMVKKGDVVCDPLCGIGPHIIPAIKKGGIGLCNDLNPAAIKWLKESLILNNISCKTIENIDACEFLEDLKGQKIDHLIVNLPEHSLEYLKFCQFFKDFWIHLFFFGHENEDICEMIHSKTGFLVKPDWIRKCRKVSPSKIVFKLEVFSSDFFSLQQISK